MMDVEFFGGPLDGTMRDLDERAAGYTYPLEPPGTAFYRTGLHKYRKVERRSNRGHVVFEYQGVR